MAAADQLPASDGVRPLHYMLKVRGSNTVEVGIGVKAAIERLKKELPGDIEPTILSDQSKYVKANVDGVKRTIIGVLTVIIVFLFPASWRSAVITNRTLVDLGGGNHRVWLASR